MCMWTSAALHWWRNTVHANPAEGFQQQSWRDYQSTAPFRYILSALTLCWRNDNNAAASRKDAPTFNLHIKAFVKCLWIFVYVHVHLNCTERFPGNLYIKLFLTFQHWASSQRKKKNCYCFPFFFYCWRNNIIEAQLRGLQHLRNAVPGLRNHGNASFDSICHPVALLWRICLSTAGFAPCLDRAHLSCWCDSCGRHPFIRPEPSSLRCLSLAYWG